MRYFIILSILWLIGCKDDAIELACSEQDCTYLNPISLGLEPIDNGVIIHYGSYGHIDGPGLSCRPDGYEILMSEGQEEFIEVDAVSEENGSHLIENLVNGREYRFKLNALHCELDPVVSSVKVINAGEVELPDFVDNFNQQFEDFRLAPDGEQYIYRTFDNDWYLSSLGNPGAGSKIMTDAFHAEWNPQNSLEIAYVKQTKVDVSPSLQGITSKALMLLDLSTGEESELHTIEHLHNFSTGEHHPEQYWIHEIQYALDGNSIYFITNKDNGSSSSYEKSVFENIYILDIATKSIEAITDFLPISFDLSDFIEDPLRPGNFYVLGKIEDSDYADIFYLDKSTQELRTILSTDARKERISINPSGQVLTFSSFRTGYNEVWSYNVLTEEMIQITNSKAYTPTFKWHFYNWIADNEFVTYLEYNDVHGFGYFIL